MSDMLHYMASYVSQVYFLDQPTLNFDLGGAASILDMPGLNSMMKDAIHDQIGLNMILPNKITVLLTDKVSPEDFKMTWPVGEGGQRLTGPVNMSTPISPESWIPKTL